MNTSAPSGPFVAASWSALLIGILAYTVGLLNSAMPLVERGYYAMALLFGLFAAVSLQKSVRDRLEGIAVTPLYFGLAWVAVSLAVLLTAVGLWNASLDLASKGFYGMAYTLSLFAAVAVQKTSATWRQADRHCNQRVDSFMVEVQPRAARQAKRPNQTQLCKSVKCSSPSEVLDGLFS